MRNQKILTRLLRGLGELVAKEAEKNPAFAAELDELFADVLATKPRKHPKAAQSPPAELPDLFEELKTRGEPEFFFWLKELPMPMLKALIKRHDFDASGRSSKWNDPEKFARLIVDQLKLRMNRGAAFLRNAASEGTPPTGNEGA